jgi:alpha-tubulin suppressor-like RCC1 family protein
MVPSLAGTWSTQPVEMAGSPSPIKAVSIDRDSSICAVDGNGKIACRFGMADNGVDPRWIPLATPAPVAELHPISTGSCARLVDGRVSCFVDERYEDDPDFLETLPKSKMQLVPGITDAAQLAAGQGDACVITRKAEVWCWRVERPKPTELPTLRGATAIAGNHLHWCAVLRGEVWCWGDNYSGQLGDGTVSGRIEPVRAPIRAKTPFTAVRVGVGRDSTCALDDQGRVWCWGSDSYSELGQGRPLSSEQPLRVAGIGPR